MYLSVNVDINDILASITQHKDAFELILAIDLRIADVGFTENIVRSLLKSLRGDLNGRQWEVLMEEFSNMSVT